MAMLQMIFEGLYGAGFWSPPVFIAATLLRDLQLVSLPVSFALIPVVLGLMGHMMNSILLGFIFVKFFGKNLTSLLKGVVFGIIHALGVFVIMWFVVLPAIDPVMLQLNPFVFAATHVVWGALFGWHIAKNTN